MSWTVVARKEVLDAVRSRALWAVTALSVAVVAGGAYLPSVAFGEVSAGVALAFLPTPVSIVVGVTAVAAGYLSVAGERESGSLRLLLTLPHRRWEVLAGKLAGRVAVVVAGLVAAFAVAAGVLASTYGSVPLPDYAALFALTLLYGAAFTAIAVGVSAAFATRARAMAVAVGAFVLFEFAWEWVPRLAYYAHNGAMPGRRVPAWYVLVERLAPMGAYDAATGFLPTGGRSIAVSSGGAAAGASPASLPLSERVLGPVPAYLDDRVAVLVLALWVVVPPLVGYVRFGRADL